jgi:PAS domain S-box-containing protein
MTTMPTYEELEKRVKELERKSVDPKQAEDALHEVEAQKQAILDASLDRIRLSDTDMKIIWANQTHEKELNIHPEELIGKHCYTVFVKRDTPCPECPSIKAIKSGRTEHTILIRPSIKNKEEMTYLDSYAVPLKNEFGTVESCIQVTRNITEQVEAEKALKESEERYRSLFDDSRDPVYITTREGEFVEVNQSFLDLFCINRDELEDIKVKQLYVNPFERSKFQKEIQKNGFVKNFEVKLKKKDGEEMDCLLTSTMWRGNDGSTLGYQGIVRDITEQKKTEQALREREEELKIQATNLKEVVTALRVLLKQRDKDKIQLEEKVLSNVKELVVPFLAKVKKTPLDYKQFAYIDILESNLNDITSAFLHNLSTKYINLTPKEIRVAYLIKEGKTTKEIGEMMAVSPRTIETHRKNIRRKLGIEKKKGNLRSRLLTFQ